jgi:hypothetical protein
MKILINGDSNMCGEELEDRSLGIGGQLCQILGGEEINLALSGASNDRIYNTTLEYINKNPAPDLIVIGWSEMCRVQWFLTDQGPEFVEINNLGVGRREYPPEYDNRLKQWFTVADNPDYRAALGYYWHERIYNLHKLLEFRKIPHVFFHAFHNFTIHDQLDWGNRFMEPYHWCYTNDLLYLSYTQWCAQNGYKEITPGWYHYEPAAQRVWAERVAAYIKEHNLTSYDL